jgi:hypothetical protein
MKKFEFTLSKVSTQFATISIESDSVENAQEIAEDIAAALTAAPEKITNYTKKGWSSDMYTEVDVMEE